MSKSVGNVLDPTELVQTYGVDYLRYYLAAEIVFGNDGDFSHESFCSRINSDLANDIGELLRLSALVALDLTWHTLVGNLAQRVLSMVHKHCGGAVPSPEPELTAEDQRLLRAVKQDLLPVLRLRLSQQNIKGKTLHFFPFPSFPRLSHAICCRSVRGSDRGGQAGQQVHRPAGSLAPAQDGQTPHGHGAVCAGGAHQARSCIPGCEFK